MYSIMKINLISDDNSRVLLTSLSDDYINASWVNVSIPEPLHGFTNYKYPKVLKYWDT